MRIATFHTGLSERGPGLLLRRVMDPEDTEVAAVVAMIQEVDPDILVLQDVDYDAGLATLTALADRLEQNGVAYPERFALRPNAGLPSGLDLNADGRRGGPRDAQGYGNFAGDGGMAILSRFLVAIGDVIALSDLLWKDVPGADLPPMSEEVEQAQRLSSVAHWIVPVAIDGVTLTLMTWHGTPPVFDGPEDRNGRRNRDETGLWLRLLDGDLAIPPPAAPFVILGVGNVDPRQGEGRRDTLRALLSDARLQDPTPEGYGGLATADYAEPLGPLRVSYLLPSAGIEVLRSGILWPAPGGEIAARLGPPEHWPRHRIVWADLQLD